MVKIMNIENFCEKYNLGHVINISKISGGLMHKMYKVETDKKIYCVKILNPEVMSRKTAYNNFVISEKISNLAKANGIPVSCALDIDGNYLTKFEDMYYMIFDYVDGKTLKDEEITVEHCKKIGNVLARIHSLNYKDIGLESNFEEEKNLYDWECYINNPNFDKMPYKELYLENYKKYNSLLKRANERYNSSNITQTICHLDMDPKNVMWQNNEPIVIDWECAKVSNPNSELIEDALCWSGFLSNNFDEEKFVTMFKEYSKYRNIENIDWYDTMCGNLIGRFNWLKYNLDRSLGIISNDEEEIILAENEVTKTIDEINRYLELIGRVYDIIYTLSIEEEKNYDDIVRKIIDGNEILRGKNFELITAGFTNTIYLVDKYVLRICTDNSNENRFANEINFYKENSDNTGIPKLFLSDTTKSLVPYYYEIIEKVNGKTLYEIWPKLSNSEKVDIVKQIINIIRPFHLRKEESYDFEKELNSELLILKEKCDLDENLFNDLTNICSKYFKDNTFGLIHGDLHFDNFIFDGNKIHLLDFERSKVAPIDYDFRLFSMYDSMPYLWASAQTDMLTVESDYADLIDMFLDNYYELSKIPNIRERIEFYSILELLDNYKNTKTPERLKEVIDKVRKLKENINNKS